MVHRVRPNPEETYSRVSAKMTALMTHQRGAPGEGWVHVCVASYMRPPAAPGAQPQKCYRLFGTSVVV